MEPQITDSGAAWTIRPTEDSGSIKLLDRTWPAYCPVWTEGAAPLQGVHLRLGQRSVYLRFFGAKPRLSERKADYFICGDDVSRFAFVAPDPEHPGEIVAIASFYREESAGRAESATVVADWWQGRGPGLRLARHPITAAKRRGITRFTGVALPENARMPNLLRDLRPPERLEDGVECVEEDISLAGAGESSGGRESGGWST